MKSSLTIKNRLFFAIVAILACSYAILFSVSIITLQSFIEDQTAKDLEYSLKFAKNQFNARQELVLESLKLPAATPSVQKMFKTSDYEGLRSSAKIWKSSLDFLEMITILDVRQKVIARINGHKEPESFLQEELLSKVLERKQPVMSTEIVPHDQYCREVGSAVCQSLPENRDVMVQLVFLPVIDSTGTVLGVIVAGDDVNKDPHLPYQQQKVFGKTVEMLVTQQDELIASTMTDTGGLPLNIDAGVLQALKNGYSFQGITDLNGRQYEMIAEVIHDYKGEFIGSIAVALSVDRFTSLRNDSYRNLIICGTFSSVLIFLLAYVTAMQFTAPIRKFEDAVTSINAGDYSTRVTESGGFEFKSLAATFNRMTESLQERDRVILKQNSELLQLNEELESRSLVRAMQLEAETAIHKSIINSLMDGLIVADERQIIIEINPAAEKLFGIKASDLIHEPLAKLYAQPGLSSLEEFVKNAMLDSFTETESVLVLKHNRRRLRFALTDLRYEKESSRGLLLGIRDVTVDGEVERLKSGFIAKVSHELKTPLTSMKGSLQFILKKGKWLTGVEREMLTVCFRNTERLIGLVAGIIDLSRIEAGQISFSMKPLQISEVILYAMEEIKGAALLRNISIVNDVPPDLPKVNGDYERLTQVLSNLLSNAVKFSPENSVITISSEVENSFISLSVTDDGKVIPEEERASLFSKFQQMGRTEDGAFAGNGLGLAISREIIERHGGSIFHSPGVAGGNVFTFKVPVSGVLDEN